MVKLILIYNQGFWLMNGFVLLSKSKMAHDCMDMIKVNMWTKPRSYNFVDYDLAKTHSYYSIVFF